MISLVCYNILLKNPAEFLLQSVTLLKCEGHSEQSCSEFVTL
jgi:hypothetical protein